jgi:hypothetical protein
MMTPDLLNNTQGMLSASNINIHTEKLNNHQGSINQSSQDDFSLTLKNGLDNRQGSITANAQNFIFIPAHSIIIKVILSTQVQSLT